LQKKICVKNKKIPAFSPRVKFLHFHAAGPIWLAQINSCQKTQVERNETERLGQPVNLRMLAYAWAVS